MRSPWIDCHSTARACAGGRGPSLAAVLERLGERTGERAGPVLRMGAAGLLLLAEGPWLSWLPLARLAALGVEPLPTAFGRRRYRSGLVARRAAEDLAPMRAFEAMVREVARDGPSRNEGLRSPAAALSGGPVRRNLPPRGTRFSAPSGRTGPK